MIVIGESFAHYRVTGKLGAGGMGEVYRAEDTKLKREVAIKVLPEAFARDEERMKRFEREAQVLASLNHPNIAAIYGLEDVDGVRALVLELVEGPTLAERIASGPLPLEEALCIARQIAVGLEAAHEKGVIHRDLKPPNVKLTEEGDVKILDFGLAKALEGETPDVEDSNSPTLTRAGTQAGVLLGTAAYMSPEQAKGKPVDRRGDVWAFGAVLFEMLTGTRLFSGETASETLASVIKDEPALDLLPAGTPQHVRRLLRRCLTKDPTERLQAIGEARIAIDQPETELETSATSRARVRLGPWIAALVASLFTGATIWSLRPEAARPLLRVVATPPASAPLSVGLRDLDVAITPDGTRIVYTVTSDGGRRLMMRALDELEATPLTRAGEDPRDPFVSPDGGWVGYFDAGTLRKVPIDGGRSVTLAERSGSFAHGASWGDDDWIVFSTGQPSRLWRVPSDGGEPEPLPVPDVGPREQLWPEVLPGSDALLFTVHGGRLGAPDVIWALSLASGESKALVTDGSNPRYGPAGYLTYARQGGTLHAVGFDSKSLEVTSEPVPVLEGVVTKRSGAADFGVARDGSLVYVEGAGRGDGQSARTMVWVDRQGREEVLAAPSRPYNFPRLSPDGSRLAVWIQDQDLDLWIWDFARETLTRLTFGPEAHVFPVWTPDALRVAFASGGDLFWKSADGTGDVERLNESASSQSPRAFSPDGKYLVFQERVPGGGTDLGVLSLEDGMSGAPLVATEFNELNADLSPDGRYLAYQSDESGRFEVFVQPFPDVEGGRWQISSDGGTRPLWARGGGELFYVTLEGQVMSVPVQTDAGFAFGNAEIVVERGYHWGLFGRTYDVSPDGERFLMIRAGEAGQEGSLDLIYVLNWGEELKRLVLAGGAR